MGIFSLTSTQSFYFSIFMEVIVDCNGWGVKLVHSRNIQSKQNYEGKQVCVWVWSTAGLTPINIEVNIRF
jgi:hypothetical protein